MNYIKINEKLEYIFIFFLKVFRSRTKFKYLGKARRVTLTLNITIASNIDFHRAVSKAF